MPDTSARDAALLEFGPQTLRFAQALDRIARGCEENDDLDGAAHALEESLAVREGLFDESHVEVINALDRLAAVAARRGDEQRADDVLRRMLRSRVAQFGSDHPATLAVVFRTAAVYVQLGCRLEQAEQMLKRTAGLREQHLGLENPLTAATLAKLGEAIEAQGRIEEAATLCERAYAVQAQLLGTEHEQVRATHALHERVRARLSVAPQVSSPPGVVVPSHDGAPAEEVSRAPEGPRDGAARIAEEARPDAEASRSPGEVASVASKTRPTAEAAREAAERRRAEAARVAQEAHRAEAASVALEETRRAEEAPHQEDPRGGAAGMQTAEDGKVTQVVDVREETAEDDEDLAAEEAMLAAARLRAQLAADLAMDDEPPVMSVPPQIFDAPTVDQTSHSAPTPMSVVVAPVTQSKKKSWFGRLWGRARREGEGDEQEPTEDGFQHDPSTSDGSLEGSSRKPPTSH